MDNTSTDARAEAPTEQSLVAHEDPRGADAHATLIGRRSFLGLAPAGVAALGLASSLGDALASGLERVSTTATSYRVGVGNMPDAYAATQQAIGASGEWPATLAGRTVVIKPNLVAAKPSTSGVTTDPQVVRAVVDQALASGATSVLIVEGGSPTSPAPFMACGYGFFATYDPRVQLVDLGTQPVTLAHVPNGVVYGQLYVPSLVLDPSVVFISVAKLKCHVDAGATLTMKNLFGLASPVHYHVPSQLPRQNLHLRGVDEAIIDLNLVRPIDFAVIDGIWGMQGNGPLSGTPVQMNIVVAGRNPVAVDRVGLQVMGLPQTTAPHLTYAALKGLGPADLTTIAVLGDIFTPGAFLPAQTPPVVWYPRVTPPAFAPASGQTTTISYSMPAACYSRVEIVRDSDVTPGITLVRTLRNWASRPAGTETLVWDGRDDSGAVVPQGSYLADVQATFAPASVINYASRWLLITS